MKHWQLVSSSEEINGNEALTFGRYIAVEVRSEVPDNIYLLDEFLVDVTIGQLRIRIIIKLRLIESYPEKY